MADIAYIQWAITALCGVVVYLAKRCIDSVDRSITDLNLQIEHNAERITACELQQATLRTELRAGRLIE